MSDEGICMKCKMKNDILKIRKGYNEIETNKVKKKHYLLRQENTIYSNGYKTQYKEQCKTILLMRSIYVVSILCI